MYIKNSITIITICVTSIASSLWAIDNLTSSNNPGYIVMQKVSDANTGWRTSQAEMTMTLINEGGEKNIRKLNMQSLEVNENLDKTLLTFDKPADVRGTSLLTFSFADSQDQQWLYLPALKRVKRIASKSRSGSFMGSEFSFEDFSSFELAEYRYQYIEEITDNEILLKLVEAYPIDEESGYNKLVNYVDQENRIRRTVFYNRRDEKLKTLEYSNFQLYKGRYWRASKMLMTNHQNNRSTVLEWDNYEFDIALREADFRKEALSRL